MKSSPEQTIPSIFLKSMATPLIAENRLLSEQIEFAHVVGSVLADIWEEEVQRKKLPGEAQN
jgi:hypothetical protein